MRPLALCLLLIVPPALGGCGPGSAPLPSTEAAREALRASLDAWKAGRPASTLAARQPGVDFVDFEWKAGQKLADYALGEESPGQGTQTFAATLTLPGTSTPKKVEYMVLGLDPIRIYRDEDFRRALNMDNAPPTNPRSKR